MLRSQFWANRKKANAAIFGAAGNNTGSFTGTMSAIQHPLRGVVTAPAHIRQGLDWFHRQQMSPAVPASQATNLPWEPGAPTQHNEMAPDPFTLTKRGCAQSLADRLTRHIYL